MASNYADAVIKPAYSPSDIPDFVRAVLLWVDVVDTADVSDVAESSDDDCTSCLSSGTALVMPCINHPCCDVNGGCCLRSLTKSDF